VELGKTLAKLIEPALGGEDSAGLDAATRGLVEAIRSRG